METPLVEFIAISVPEQFMMALFAWVILGKKETAKFRNVLFVGLFAALVFRVLQIFLKNYIYTIVPQVLIFAGLIYFLYKVNVIEAVVSCLVTMIIFATIQGAMFNVLCLWTGMTEAEFKGDNLYLLFFAVQYFIVISAIVYVIYRLDINIRYLGKKNVKKHYVSRIRFLILQLVFAFLQLIIIYTIVVRNIEFLNSQENVTIVFLAVVITITFTALVVKSVIKMGEHIKREEEQKRQYDGREIIQNINYLYTLVEEKKYDELKSALESIKDDINSGMVRITNKANK
ncbi:MAG: hypothetical protein GX387_07120 [Clostridium sp.]|jgi:hypothetical protein|nr:hypothetical protein [Clostridium sp.]